MTNVTDLPPEATKPSNLLTTIGKDAKPQDRPDCERAALTRMRQDWEVPDLLLGRTRTMQEAGERVLPKEQDETDEEYKRRISRTVLTNYYGNTLDTHSGMPFSTPITFEPPLPDALKYLEQDADGCGRSITVFARDVLREAMHRGLCHVLVDIPKGEAETYADTLRRRPRLLEIRTSALLGVTDQPGPQGEDVVDYARFRQSRTDKVGTFGEKTVEVILEIDVAAKQVVEWRASGDGAWTSMASPYTQDAIPFFTLYTKQTGDYEGEPAYAYLAELNHAHFKSDADQRHALSFGRRATVMKTGWQESSDSANAAAKGQDAKKRTALGYNRQISNKNDGAKAYFLETSGAPLAAGETDLKGLEERMERFGAQQISKGGGITATSRQLDNQRDTCNLEAWCTREELVILQAVFAVARLLNIKLPATQKAKIDRSFADSGPRNEHVPHIFQAQRDRLITPATANAELKLRGILQTVADPAAEAAAAAAAAQAEANVAAEMERRAQEAIAARGGGQPPPAEEPTEPVEGEGDDEVTLNEITLGIERLARIKDTKLVQALREQLAAKLGIGSPGRFTPAAAPQPIPQA